MVSSLIVCCSPQKRLNRLVENHPQLIEQDTIHFIDSVQITTNKVVTDTLVSLNSITHDTLIVNKENMTIKTFYNYETDSIYIFGECDTITITKVIERDIPVEKYKIVEQKNNPFLLGVILSLAVALVLLFGYITFFKNK